MRLPMSSLPHRVIRNQSLSVLDDNMSSSGIYSIELPYLGAIFLGKSPLNLTSFQKPLRELYSSYYHEHFHDERRIIISDYDILIFQSDRATKSKRTYIYSKLESIVDIQILKLSVMGNKTENQQQKRMQAAFLPIGCEYQERFRSLYSTMNKTQHNLFSTPTSSHPPLLLFVIRKAGISGLCSLLDCHVFTVRRESTAFELCDMIRKLIVKRTISPILSRRETLVPVYNNNKDGQIKYLEHDLPMSTMKQQQIDNQTNNHLISNVSRSITNTRRNPLSSSSLVINNVQHSPPFHDTSKVLTMNSDIHRMSSPCSTSKQRCFIKASSSLIQDESDEIVNDLMNIVASEQLKNQVSIKRHASFDQTSYSNDSIMNKKRYFYNKKRLLNSIPVIHDTPHQQKSISMIDGHLLRPQIVLNRYGDIGNYVPKFLRENVTMRSSDSNENIFFRSTNGQLLNGFLKSDILSPKPIDGNHNNNHYLSTPCLNQDQNIYSLVEELRKNQTKSFTNIYQSDSNVSNAMLHIEVNRTDDDHRVPHLRKSLREVRSNNKIHPLKSNISATSSTTKRVASFNIAKTELPIDYRQYLRHTDQGAYLYGEEQRQYEQQTTLEHSLGYLP